MLTINDIINASFNKSNFGGYKTEDVDIFIDEVKESYRVTDLKRILSKKKRMKALLKKIEN